MNILIAYDIDTYIIKSFIANNYSTLEDADEIFQNFENYKVGISFDNSLDLSNLLKYKIVEVDETTQEIKKIDLLNILDEIQFIANN